MVIESTLRKKRKSKNLTIALLAQLSGLSVATISNAESGKSKPQWASVEKLAAALGCDPGVIADQDEYAAIVKSEDPKKQVAKAAQKRWYKNNKEQELQKHRAYKEAHKEELREKRREYYEKNRESEKAASNRRYREKRNAALAAREGIGGREPSEPPEDSALLEKPQNLTEGPAPKKTRQKMSEEERLARNRERANAFYLENRDRVLEEKKKNYQANREKILEYQREYYQANREKILENAKSEKRKEYNRNYFMANREEINKKNRERNKQKRKNEGKPPFALRGVSFIKNKNEWVAYKNFMGKKYILGRYLTEDDAITARCEAEAVDKECFIDWCREKYGNDTSKIKSKHIAFSFAEKEIEILENNAANLLLTRMIVREVLGYSPEESENKENNNG